MSFCIAISYSLSLVDFPEPILPNLCGKDTEFANNILHYLYSRLKYGALYMDVFYYLCNRIRVPMNMRFVADAYKMMNC